MDLYLGDDDARRWDEGLAQEDYDLASAYVLGIDIGEISRSSHHEVIESFLELVGDEDSVVHAQMERRAPTRWQTEEQPLHRRLLALAAGLARPGA
jgi:predicted nucleotidyltransferase